MDELWGQVLVEWDRTLSEVCRNVIESKPRRIGAVIKAKRAQAEYYGTSLSGTLHSAGHAPPGKKSDI